MNKILIYGSSGFAKEVAFLIEDINRRKKEYEILGYLDDNPANHGKIVYNYPVLGDQDYLNHILEPVNLVIGIGNPRLKEKIVSKLQKFSNIIYPILVHPNVIISKSVKFLPGTIITAGNIFTVDIEIGKHVTINLDCTIGHDTVIEDYVTLAPSVNVSGNVYIECLCDIGTGTQIIQGKRIGADSIIGAGSVVTKDIPQKVVAVGVPAKAIKER